MSGNLRRPMSCVARRPRLPRNPDLSGSVCLPGTHTKWVRISNGRIEEFRAYLSGEFFGLLRTHSVLRFFLDGEEWDDSVFAETAEASLAAPQTFLSDLFGIRADALLNGMPSGVSRPRLSGLILGRVDKLDFQVGFDLIQGGFCGGYRGALADGGRRMGVL